MLSTLDQVRAATEHPGELTGVRAVIAPFIPSGIVSALAADGIAAFSADANAQKALEGEASIAFPAAPQWGDNVTVTTPKGRVDLAYLAIGAERAWVVAGTSRPPPKTSAQR